MVFKKFITEKLELIEAGKAGPVGSPKEDTPSPKPQPIRDQKSGFLATDVNILENGMGLEPELPEINFQVWTQFPEENQSLCNNFNNNPVKIIWEGVSQFFFSVGGVTKNWTGGGCKDFFL